MKNFLIILILLVSCILTAKNDFHFAVLSDRAGGVNQEAFQKVVEEIKLMGPDFIITVGDLADNGEEDQYKQAMEIMKTVKVPVYYAPGNNDIVDAETAKLFKKYTGRDPYYSFNYQNSHFIILDNSRCETYAQMDTTQKIWLAKDLERNKNKENIYVVMHKPFWADGINAKKEDKMHKLFTKYNVKAVFTGHWHQYAHDKFDKTDYYLVGSSGAGFGKPNDSLGMFYQFLWGRVIDDSLKTAVIKSGGIFKNDLMTMNEELLTYKIENDLISSKGIWNEGTGKFEITLINETDKPIEQKIILESKDNWNLPVKEQKIVLNPGETIKKDFEAYYLKTPFPYPKLKFSYPFGRNKTYNYENSLNILPKGKIANYPQDIIVDGIISKKEYNESLYLNLFCDAKGNPANIESTYLYLTRDKLNLYLGIEALSSFGDSVNIKSKDNDSIFASDYFCILVSQDKDLVYQICLNQNSAVWDMKCDLKNYSYETNWDSSAQSKFLVENNKVTGDISIPFKQMNFDPAKPIYLNFKRYQAATKNEGMLTPSWNLSIERYLILE